LNINQYIKNNISVGFATLSQKLFSILSIFFIINLSSLSVYGNYIIISSIASLLLGISSFGIGYNYMQKYSSSSNHIKGKLFFSQFFSHFGVVILITLFFLFLNRYIDFSLNGNHVYFVIYFILLFLSVQLLNFFRYSEDFKIYSRLLSIPNILNCSFFAYFYYKSETIDLYNLILIISISLVIQILISMFLLFKKIKINFLFLNQKEIFRDIKNGLPFRLNFLLTNIINSSDRYIIMFFLGSEYVGIYSILFTVSSLVLMVPSVMTTMLQPTLSRLKIEKNITDLKQSIYLSESIFFALWTPFLIGGIFYIDRILNIFSNEFIFIDNIPVFIALAIGSLFNGLIIIKGNIYFAFTETKKMLSPLFIASIVNIILNILLIYIYKSIFFAALSSLIAYFIAFSIFQYQIIKTHSIGFKIDKSIQIILSSLLMVTFAFTLDNLLLENSDFLLFKIIFSSMIYFLSMYFFMKRLKWNS
jgi:O-antigen/teichoic acid export membrane protein